MEGSKGGRQGGRKEGDAGALQSRWSFRCRGNPSAACVASAQQYASDSPDPVKTNKQYTRVISVKVTSKRKCGQSEKSTVIPCLCIVLESRAMQTAALTARC